MQEVEDTRMGTEPVSGLMFSLALPSILAQVINILYNIVTGCISATFLKSVLML
ncbi:hypothetical protein [Carnobacterium mobile]|uniref:hypothetical protein n=1 Tax=Carnobacterium mobile TaxID=2750 RepID=UPI001D024789|nr:hypothetical protein [Carnobacterium mobile]